MSFVNKKTVAELIGTFWLVLGGCGAAVFAGSQIGFAGISLAFGLTVLTGAYAFGHVSGAHFNPAVTMGLLAAGRFDKKDVIPYIVAQTVGAILAALVIWAVQAGNTGLFSSVAKYGFAVNGFADLSPAKYNFAACALVEVVLTFIFLAVILGATDKRAPQGFAPAAIGLCLTLIHLVGIPVTNLSVNPARSFGPALVEMLAKAPDAFQQVWFFIVFPVVGAMIAGWLYKFFFDAEK